MILKDLEILFASFVILFASVVVNTQNPVSDFLSTDFLGAKQAEIEAIEVSMSFLGEANDVIDFTSPIDNPSITSEYGLRINPLTEEEQFHLGIDVVSLTNLNVYAVAHGTVSYTGYDDSYGNYMVIDHKDGYQSLYAHLEEIFPHTDVLQGEKIGVLGSTGASTGEHLHIEILKDGENIDPLSLITIYED